MNQIVFLLRKGKDSQGLQILPDELQPLCNVHHGSVACAGSTECLFSLCNEWRQTGSLFSEAGVRY